SPPRPFYVPVLSQRPSSFSPEELLPFGNRRRPLLAGVLCPQPALQGIAGLRGAVEISAERNRGGDVISPPRDLLLNSLGVACFCRARKVQVLSSPSALRALRL
ncbi:hypothetical protein J1605_009455, partial [Eschrichtius robustus]